MTEYTKIQGFEFENTLGSDKDLYMQLEDYATCTYITKESAELIIEHLKKVFEL